MVLSRQLLINKLLEKLPNSFGTVNRWPIAVQADFFSTLANLLKIGFSLTAALKFICETDQHLKSGTKQIIDGLETGSDFSKCVQPLISSQAYQQILISEKHGQLRDVLNELATFNRLKLKQIKKIKTVMIYPAFLCIILLTLIIVIHTFVFPQIETLMPSVSTAQPELIDFHLLEVIGLAIGTILIILTISFFKQPVLKKAEIVVKIPFLGSIFKRYIAYYLASNLATLLRNGLSVKEIYSVLCAQKTDSIIYALGEMLNTSLTKGNSLKKIVETHHFIPKEIIKFLNSGDTVTEMANSMTAYSKLMFDEILLATDKLIAFIQPTMFLMIGVTIVATYFQLLIPIYDSVKGLY
ncbi:type II secretion system F family protein [Lentilactobacillus hilgardii]|uniref:type II secretion system F family protein n=1 Tax=Lentilactobacillus hilgardii TaxID=1588 RepID=UPI00019C5F26|nr:type II secretion system F family protein [Lentilactobacillus hilgardii]EEI19032.1 bacterial type II secretion system domain protein F [Lentilactobacillus buchneri ATCC 11577]